MSGTVSTVSDVSLSTEQSKEKFPPQIYYIVGNEAAERFSYYGMRSILFVFMTQTLLMPAHEAKGIYHLFISACYLLPLLGGWLADKYLGKYKTILYLSTFYCFGHAVLAVWESKTALFVGLGLIALGSGGIKPCISAFVGDQFTAKNKHLINRVYDWFYFSVNFGAFFSSLLIPFILPRFGSGVAFGIPGILMFLALIIFLAGKKHYVNTPPTSETGGTSFLTILLYSLKNWGSDRKGGDSFIDVARSKYDANDVEGAKAAWNIFKLFTAITLFWALFDQQGASWTEQAMKMDLNVFGYNLEASQIQALNPIMVMLLIPLFSGVVYPMITKMGFEMTMLRKLSIGMLTAGSSFISMGIFQVFIDDGVKLSVAWQILPYLLLTMSEVMVSITGLEFAYTQAPKSMKGTIMSFWLLTVFGGNLLAAIVAELNQFKGPMEFFFFAGLMVAVSFVFIWAASRYKMRDQLAG